MRRCHFATYYHEHIQKDRERTAQATTSSNHFEQPLRTFLLSPFAHAFQTNVKHLCFATVRISLIRTHFRSIPEIPTNVIAFLKHATSSRYRNQCVLDTFQTIAIPGIASQSMATRSIATQSIATRGIATQSIATQSIAHQS